MGALQLVLGRVAPGGSLAAACNGSSGVAVGAGLRDRPIFHEAGHRGRPARADGDDRPPSDGGRDRLLPAGPIPPPPPARRRALPGHTYPVKGRPLKPPWPPQDGWVSIAFRVYALGLCRSSCDTRWARWQTQLPF